VLVAFNLVEHINGAAYEPALGPLGYQRVTTSARRPFPTKDGHVCILPYTDAQWRSFFTAVGRPELMDEPGFATYSARVNTVNELYGFVASVTPTRTNAEWVEICEKGQIPCMPVVDIQALMEDEHLKAVGMFEPHHHPSEGATVLVRPPLTMTASPPAIRTHAPGFGEHSRELARELGYDDTAIDTLLSSGALIAHEA